MSSRYVSQALPPPSTALDGAWQGRVAEDVTAADQLAYALIPDLADDVQIGPARWSAPGDTFPNRGDHCLVIFDNGQQPWLIVWPYES